MYKDIETLLKGHDSKKVGNNTYLYKEGDDRLVLKLHGNLIAIATPKYVELHSGGWHSVTTKRRLNWLLEIAGIPRKIFQHDWDWFFTGQYQNRKPTPFTDGIMITYTGRIDEDN